MKIKISELGGFNDKPRPRRKDKAFCCIFCKRFGRGRSHGKRGRK